MKKSKEQYIYVVTHIWYHEGSDLVSTHISEEGAIRFAQKYVDELNQTDSFRGYMWEKINVEDPEIKAKWGRRGDSIEVFKMALSP